MKSTQILLLALLVVAIIGAGVVAGLALVRSLSQPEPTATALAQPKPTLAATVLPSPSLEPTAAPSPADLWDRIRTSGRMVVGTSADYPPFEYLTDEFQIDGFDIALMDEIARRLGVQVEYRNFAFDGLASALQLGQIDAAIAAISVTPEREAYADFTNIYFVGEDAVLAPSGSPVQALTLVDRLAEYRVGVQRGTVYEAWLEQELVANGKMPAGNLFAYERVADAMRDLQQERIDLVVLDAQPAELALAAGGVKLVARGLNPQRYAIALPKGAASLTAELNRALDELAGEQFILQLAQQYLRLDSSELLPTPPPSPEPSASSTPAPLPPCVEGLAFLSHMSFDDQGMAAPPVLNPGEPFVKGWRVQNTGTCVWDDSYRLVYVHGNDPAARMGGEPRPVQGQIAMNESYDLSVDLTAPLTPGTYEGFWQMENGQGQPFGERLVVGVQVPAAPTATPAPTQTPAPGISLTVDRTSIRRGECVFFAWEVDNAQAVYFSAAGEQWQDHAVAGSGHQQQCPPASINYYLRVVKPDNSVEVRQTTIYVGEAVDSPRIERFSADPPNQIVLGGCVNLVWQVEGSVSKVSLSANGGPLWADAPSKGSYWHCPDIPGMIGYGLAAEGRGGTSRAQQNVRVLRTATTPMPTAAPELPVVYSFAVSPNQIRAGECVNLSWETGGATSLVTILRDQNVVLDDAPISGSVQDCPTTVGSVAYSVVSYNAAGQSDARQETIVVSEVAQANPLAGTAWQATAYYDGTQMASVLAGTLLTAGFGADGGLDGSSGCNTYSGGYVVDGDALAVTPLASTLVSCGEPAGIMEQEAAFLTAFESAASYGLEGDGLVMRDASGQVMLEFVANGP